MKNFSKNKNKKKLFEEKKGFTLIELMVVVAIFAIMAGVAFSHIASTRGNVELETAANELVAAIRETQNYALTGKLGDESDVCSGYVFAPGVPASNSYTISASNPDDCSFSISKEIGGSVVVASGGAITFNAPHADKIPPGMTDIVLEKNGSNYHVCVNGAGRITKNSTICN